jgi:hypothetical protein
MFAVGDHVGNKGRKAIVTGIINGPLPTYQLRYLPPSRLDRGSTARADELELMPPLTFKTGQGVSIAGIRGEVVEELADGRYKVQGETGDQRGKGYSHTSEWILDGWRLTLAP